MIIGLVGFAGSGKDTAADYLVNHHGFVRDSFASALKDVVAAVFHWDRELLEGRSAQSRAWRDQVDAWWAQRLNMPALTPRWVLQHWGTDVLRKSFHDDIWIASLERRLQSKHHDVVVTDVRFPNEIRAIRQAQGKVIRISRGADPAWFQHAQAVNAGPRHIGWALSKDVMHKNQVHYSEWAWVGYTLDAEIQNNASMDALGQALRNLVLDPRVSRDDSHE